MTDPKPMDRNRLEAMRVRCVVAELFGPGPLADAAEEILQDAARVRANGVETELDRVLVAAAHLIVDARPGVICTYQADDGSWSVSESQVWVEGCYATREAAELAPRVNPDQLSKLYRSQKPTPITLIQLKDLEG